MQLLSHYLGIVAEHTVLEGLDLCEKFAGMKSISIAFRHGHVVAV